MKGSLVLLAAMALCLVSTASAQPIVNVSPQTINAELGDVFTVCITVDPMGDEIYAAQYDLFFDNSVLNATAQTQGVFLSIGGDTFVTKNEINNTIGKIMYGETILTAANGVTTPGILATITFRVVGDGTCNLDLEDVVLSDPDLEEIDGVIANDGICTIKNVTTMLVEPSHQDVSYGDVFTVNITVDPKGEPVYAAQYKLLFDTTMLNVISQTPGGFLSQDGSSTYVQWNTLDNTTGETTYKETRIGDVGGITSRGTLASITFEVIGSAGTGSLNLNEVMISNSTDHIEPILTRNATFTLSSSVSAYSMSIMSTEGEHGAIVHIPININNVVNGPIQAIGFDVLYDHSILKLDYDNDNALLNGDLTTGDNWTFILGTNEQSIMLATSNQSQAVQNGLTGSVVPLNFTVIGDAGETTSLELSDIEFSDPSGYNIGTAPAINGTFTVAGTVAGEAKPQKPFLIYGYVWYDDETPCNNPGVSITNLDTGEEWAAETSSGSNYYQIALTSGVDLNAGEMLRFNVTDGTSTNLTDHTITADEVNNGGLFGFNLTLESTGDPAPHLVTYTISNTTISPNGDGIMDDTEIDVKFSESVDAAIRIENATGIIRTLYTGSTVTDPDPQTWNGTDDGGSTVADGTYRMNVTMDDGVNPMVYDNSRSIRVANMSVTIISIGNGSGIVTIPIAIEDGVNVGACDITLTYNASVVNVTNVTDGDMDVAIANLEHAHEGFVRIGAFQTDNPGMNGNITFANVTFEPVGSVGDTCFLNLSVTTFKDETPVGNVMPYIVQNGTYCTLLNGDADGDGVVDLHDAMYLAKHVLDESGYEWIIEEAADVNGDGKITSHDAMYLAKHVIGISGYEELR